MTNINLRRHGHVSQLTYVRAQALTTGLGSQVLAEVDDGSTSYEGLKEHHDALDHTFWLLGRHTLLQRHFPLFSEDAVFKLFRIFCLLADKSSERKGLIQVRTFAICERFTR